MNRSTAALVLSRRDWANYQTYVAAGFARRAAAAIASVIPKQRAVSKALVHKKLLYGVGPADQRSAQRYVRAHGFPRAVQQIMVTLGMNSTTLAFAKAVFVRARPNPLTFSMSRYLSAAKVIAAEKTCLSALEAFADRVPAVPKPS